MTAKKDCLNIIDVLSKPIWVDLLYHSNNAIITELSNRLNQQSDIKQKSRSSHLL